MLQFLHRLLVDTCRWLENRPTFEQVLLMASTYHTTCSYGEFENWLLFLTVRCRLMKMVRRLKLTLDLVVCYFILSIVFSDITMYLPITICLKEHSPFRITLTWMTFLPKFLVSILLIGITCSVHHLDGYLQVYLMLRSGFIGSTTFLLVLVLIYLHTSKSLNLS